MITVDEATGDALRRAIAQTGGGETIFVPSGTYDLGQTGLQIDHHRIQILCEPGTRILYKGSGTAIRVGNDDRNIEGFKLSGCDINLSGNSNDGACCLKLIRSFWGTIQDIRLTSDNGSGSPRQFGLMVSGGSKDQAGFSAYNLILNPAVIGSFKKGIWFGSEIKGGPSTRDRSNANTVIGGSVYCGASNKTGSIGIHIEHGDTNRILGTDHDSLEIGTQIDGHANQVNARYENITRYAVSLSQSSQGSFIFGSAIPANEFYDGGYETQYIITSQAGVNKTLLTKVASRYGFQLVPQNGQPDPLEDGMMWYDWNDGKIKARVNGATRIVNCE